jgi:hypothetical protein
MNTDGKYKHGPPPFLGWRTMLQLLARRPGESNAFSVPDRNALWSRAEDGLLVQAVAKYSTSNVLRRDWSEVAWELPGRSEQQCKERYSLADTVVQLTFVFLRVIFRGSPTAFRSSHVLTNDADSADSARPLHYSKSDCRVARVPVLSPCSSLTHAHRSIDYHNRNPQSLAESDVRLMYLRVYDSRDSSRQPAPSPSLCYSLTHAHRSIGYLNRNPQSLAESAARLMYVRVYDSRDSTSQPSPSLSRCYSLTHAHRSLTLSIHNKQTESVRNPESPRTPVYTRSVNPSTLTFSLSSHRHSYISLLYISRFQVISSFE